MKKYFILFLILSLLLVSCDYKGKQESERTDMNLESHNTDIEGSSNELKQEENNNNASGSLFTDVVQYMPDTNTAGLLPYRFIETKDYGVIIWRDTAEEKFTVIEAFDLATGAHSFDLQMEGSYTNERIINYKENKVQVATAENIYQINLDEKDFNVISLPTEVKSAVMKTVSYYPHSAFKTYDYDKSSDTIFYAEEGIIYSVSSDGNTTETVFNMDKGVGLAETESEYFKLFRESQQDNPSLHLSSPNIVDGFLVAKVANGNPAFGSSGYVTLNLNTKEESWFFDIINSINSSEHNLGADAFYCLSPNEENSIFFPATGNFKAIHQTTGFLIEQFTNDLEIRYYVENQTLIKENVVFLETDEVASFGQYDFDGGSTLVGEHYVLVSFKNLPDSTIVYFLVPFGHDSSVVDLQLRDAIPSKNFSLDIKNGSSINRETLQMSETDYNYFHKYLAPIAVRYNPFTSPFSKNNFSSFSASLVYSNLLQNDSIVVLPAETVESFVSQYFPISAQEMKDLSNPYGYNSQRDEYTIGHYTPYEDTEIFGAIINSQKEGNTLVLECLWYHVSLDGEIEPRGISTTTIDIFEDHWFYRENTVEEYSQDVT